MKRTAPVRPTNARALARSGPTPLALWLALAALVVVLDQFAKTIVVSQLRLGDAIPVFGWLDVVRAHNRGAAFSMLAEAGGWQRWFFLGVALAATVAIVWMLRRHAGQRLFCLAISLILGGALGNAIDRLLHGHVVDFIAVHGRWLAPMFPGGHFPAFNVADAAITLGATLLIVDELRRVMRSR